MQRLFTGMENIIVYAQTRCTVTESGLLPISQLQQLHRASVWSTRHFDGLSLQVSGQEYNASRAAQGIVDCLMGLRISNRATTSRRETAT